MGLPEDPISGDYELSNTSGVDYWSCPNCYEDHFGQSEGAVIKCHCGATLKLHVDHEPVNRAECIDPDDVVPQ